MLYPSSASLLLSSHAPFQALPSTTSFLSLQYLPLPSGDVPPASPKYRYGKVSVAAAGSVFQMADLLQTVSNKWPLTFEQLLVPNGIVVYKTVLPFRIVSVDSYV